MCARACVCPLGVSASVLVRGGGCCCVVGLWISGWSELCLALTRRPAPLRCPAILPRVCLRAALAPVSPSLPSDSIPDVKNKKKKKKEEQRNGRNGPSPLTTGSSMADAPVTNVHTSGRRARRRRGAGVSSDLNTADRELLVRRDTFPECFRCVLRRGSLFLILRKNETSLFFFFFLGSSRCQGVQIDSSFSFPGLCLSVCACVSHTVRVTTILASIVIVEEEWRTKTLGRSRSPIGCVWNCF